MRDVDVLVAGGGPAGLACACGMALKGFTVALADPEGPSAAGAKDQDRRTVAVLRPGRALLEEIGAWDALGEPVALDVMRVVDLRAGASAGFESREVGDAPFGWNVPTGELRAALEARADALGVERVAGGVEGIVARSEEALVTVAGEGWRARLLVGADGKASAVRDALGIGVREVRTGQKALSFRVRHAVPHANVSTELYDREGPLVLVPLPDEDGAHRSAVVWMVSAPEAERLLALDGEAFAQAATERSGETLGDLALEGERTAFPIVTRVAKRLTGPRSVLIAEAAHALPPIGAQGLNTSLGDVAELLRQVGDDPGASESLARWARRRWPEIASKVAAVTALNAASIGGPMAALRGPAIAALSRAPGLRRGLMRFGLG